ncbi:MAG: nitroreductase family protein [Lachnospiraceae bacterium]
MSFDYENFSELAHTRRSIRKLLPDPIPEGSIEKILECGRWAMSGGNSQPWEFIVITEPETKLKMAEIWAEYMKEFAEFELTRIPEIRHPLFSRPAGLPNWKDAPAIIGLIGDRRKTQINVLHPNFYGAEGGDSINASYLKALGNAAMMMHLAACALGLASQHTSLEKPVELNYKRLLGIPDELELHSLVIVGYPAFDGGAGYRRELSEIVHYEKYNPDLFRTAKDLREEILASRAAVRAEESKAYKLRPVEE